MLAPQPPPGMSQITVQVPAGATPGMVLTVQAPNGTMIQVQIPQGAGPGSTFMVSVPGGAGGANGGAAPPGVPLPPAPMPWASPATETGAEFEPAFKGTLHVNEIGFKAAHHGKRFQEMARANRESYAAAATEAAVKAGARPTISTATLFRHQYPNTLGRYKAYQEQKEWK